MATMITGATLVGTAPAQNALGTSRTPVGARCRRKMSPETGRAVEMLGHAIEYLADEFSLECLTRQHHIAAGMHPRVVAIEILKKCNREVYLNCPEIPSFAERLRSLLRLQRA